MSQVTMIISNAFRPDPRVLNEACSMVEAGHQVNIIGWDRACEKPPAETLENGIQIYRIQTIRSGYGLGAQQLARVPRYWLALFSYLNRLKPEIVHCHDFDTLPGGLLWGKLHSRPVIYDAREHYAELVKPRLNGPGGKLLFQFIRSAERVCARLASAIITVDETLGAIYRRYNRRVIIIGHYPPLRMVGAPAPVFTRPELHLLYAGRLSVDRGLLTNIDILRRLLDRGIPARLFLAGVFTPASEEKILHDYMQGVQDKVNQLGWVDYNQMPAVLHSADVGLAVLHPVPRYVAALPVKLFEYMSAGVPSVISNFPANASIVNEAQCGFLVDPLNPAECAEKIAFWWEHPEIARQAGENGRQAILTRYNWETLMGQLNQLYELLGKR